LKKQRYLRMAHEMTLPLYDFKPTMPCVGGGVTPGIVKQYLKDLGEDIVLSPGGAIHGHPQGAAAGVRAMYQAIEAAQRGIPYQEAAVKHEELRIAVDLWGCREV